MSIKQWFKKHLTNHAETSEQHWNNELQTHYFKTTKDKAFRAIEKMYENASKYDIIAKSEEHGEVSVGVKGSRKAFMVISVIMVKPYRTAIDFSVTTETPLPFDFGYSHKLIQTQYESLKKELPFLETSMAEKMEV
ncbi:hypothetical protein [Pontibacillus marinus]|uniref:Cytosolic protein n=1 Tax=Pontibacillus marinus BH030004 = DSM 16465 TaxID=1385511 RepID=A0A0A5FXL5_9BACI|nr:hypothetical protein [Pontibacillus marinus]KGX83568.1 hypothetical protein N783_02605 [Pontibacillus marinus BH030004 = DSM 16465]